jgi:hypothetical protein
VRRTPASVNVCAGFHLQVLGEEISKMIEVPPLPLPGHLVVDDPVWSYRSGTVAGGGLAHLRVWTAEPGHLAIVTELDLGSSTTNSAEHIWSALVDQFGEPLVMLEHYPPDQTMPGDGDRLDQVVVVDGQPYWERIWPTDADHPEHAEFNAWMRTYGFDLLAGHKS